MQRGTPAEDVCTSGFTDCVMREHTGAEQHRADLDLGVWGVLPGGGDFQAGLRGGVGNYGGSVL